jgi:imidazolonepropionase-like amidohydrolase
MHEGVSVLVRSGWIVAVGPDLVTPADGELINGAGQTLLPGLIDAHAHARGGALREQLVFGVTTVLDMFTEHGWAADMRRQQGVGQGLDRADLFSAGTLVTAPGGHGTEHEPIPTLASASEAQAFVDARLAEGSDYIKVVYDDGRTSGHAIPTLDRPTLKAVIDAAHARGKLAIVHIAAVTGAAEALAAGADGLAHVSPDAPMDDEVVALARQRQSFVTPTLSVNESSCNIPSGASLVDDPRVAPFLSAFSAKNLASSFHPYPPRPLDFANASRSVGKLHAAGVPILAGTDAPNPGTAHGASIHRELELLVAAGLTPLEALGAATAVPARAFRLTDRGQIAVGLRADLVLVRGDPASDIRATRDITAIWKLGTPVHRASFRAELHH